MIEFSNYDLTLNESRVLEAHSRGVFDLHQFAQIPLNPSRNDGNFSGNALGIVELDNDLAPYFIACKSFNLRDCYNFSVAYKIRSEQESNKTWVESAMESLTQAQIPLVFFVPTNLRTHSKAYYTPAEMDWSLRNLNKIGDMIFVFGLYEYLMQLKPYLPANLDACGQYLINSLTQY